MKYFKQKLSSKARLAIGDFFNLGFLLTVVLYLGFAFLSIECNVGNLHLDDNQTRNRFTIPYLINPALA